MDEKKRSGDSRPMKELVDKLMTAYQLKGKMQEMEVLSKWEEIVGKGVAIRTTNLQVKSGVLIVALNSSVMRNELQHSKQLIIDRVNHTAGFAMIHDIWLE
jgi:hypothetical protein